MQSTFPASRDRLVEAPIALRVLCICFAVLLAILPLGHVTALRNVLVGLIAAAALLQFRLAPWRNIPGFVPWLIWLGFAAASIGWSALPAVSFQSFRSDQFYPFVIFLVSFVLAQFQGGRLAAVAGTAAGTLLCLATMFAAAAAGSEPRADTTAAGILGWFAWKASDPTDSSTYVAFVAVPLFLILVTSRHLWRRWGAAVWLLVFAAIGFMSESRTLVVSLFVSFAGFLIVLGILRRKLNPKAVAAIVILGLLASAASLEVISRVRFSGSQPTEGSAAVAMIKADPRPAIWAAYLDIASRQPWLGIGLGRTVPSRAYNLGNDDGLRRIDSQASTHAHNVLLDLVLQVGVIGLAIWVWLHVEILRLVLRRARDGGDREKAWAAAAVALVLAMLVKNSTNDLIVFGNAILFWALLGTMMGLVWRDGVVSGDANTEALPLR